MNSNFQRLMLDAARLAQSAKAQALSSIRQSHRENESSQQAMGGSSPMHSNPVFQKLMAEAAQLTQGGNLQAATAAIQAALHGAALQPSPTTHDANVIDVEAHEVGRDATDQPRQEEGVKPDPSVAPGPAGQFISGQHAEGADSRDYKLYLPPASGEEPLPLVVMLHGCTQNPDDFAAGTGMNDAALQRGFYVLYPAQTQHANASRCWNWFKRNHQKRGRGEPALLAGMTKEVMARYNVDPQRVYVAGLSAGGAMAAILGDAYPDLFAAVGVHSGLPTGAATNMPGALSAMKTGAAPAARTTVSPPTIVFHGDQDTTVSPVNGEQVISASAGLLKCEKKRARRSNGREYTQRTYKDGGGSVVAEHWAVHGAGHAWSGGSARGSYTDATGPDATQEMIRFFLDHPLRKTH